MLYVARHYIGHSFACKKGGYGLLLHQYDEGLKFRELIPSSNIIMNPDTTWLIKVLAMLCFTINEVKEYFSLRR